MAAGTCKKYSRKPEPNAVPRAHNLNYLYRQTTWSLGSVNVLSFSAQG
ncbi:MAG: hypothetical protein OXD32_00530 [Endozoicomonadaceae bacterium]|nr:hypothetical protein [Endozoicomonadaceae bacterium]MCY4329634.1 hypothetical protein [Endozoicomonadaceae bacterium]